MRWFSRSIITSSVSDRMDVIFQHVSLLTIKHCHLADWIIFSKQVGFNVLLPGCWRGGGGVISISRAEGQEVESICTFISIYAFMFKYQIHIFLLVHTFIYTFTYTYTFAFVQDTLWKDKSRRTVHKEIITFLSTDLVVVRKNWYTDRMSALRWYAVL